MDDEEELCRLFGGPKAAVEGLAPHSVPEKPSNIPMSVYSGEKFTPHCERPEGAEYAIHVPA